MIDKKIKTNIEEAIEFNQPIILLLKTSVETKKRMEVIQLIMKSSMPTKVTNFKVSKKIDKEFINDINELNRQLNEGIENQWIIVFKNKDEMQEAFSAINMTDIIEECVILEIS